jgi:hypothetical protein
MENPSEVAEQFRPFDAASGDVEMAGGTLLPLPPSERTMHLDRGGTRHRPIPRARRGKCAAGFFIIAALAQHANSMSQPAEILRRAKAASGGPAWDRTVILHQSGSLSIAGLNGTIDSWCDVRAGRYTDRFTLGPDSGAGGFTGSGVWKQDSSGQVRAAGSSAALEQARTEAYRCARGYFYPDRWPARIEPAAANSLRITPEGGHPFELRFDPATGLIAGLEEKRPNGTLTETYSDYRDAGGLRLPFRIVSKRDNQEQIVTLHSIEAAGAPRDALFAVPPPPPPDFQIQGGADSTAVPIEFVSGTLYVMVRLNGQGPFRFVLDSGSFNVLTPELAGRLSLAPEGKLPATGTGEGQGTAGLVKIDRVDVGAVWLSNQLFTTISFDSLNHWRGGGFEGTIGYELFKRLVVDIDYDRGRATLTQPERFTYRGKGAAIPFQFAGRTPLIGAELDGVRGEFTIDTGSGKTLDLARWFWERSRLWEKYQPKFSTITGHGVGGVNRGAVVRAGLFRVGPYEVRGPVIELSAQRSGAYASTEGAGNIGQTILSRFNMVFDYPHQRIYFEPNSRYGEPQGYDRSGLAVIETEEGFLVQDVVTGSPALQAGIAAGDRIIAVDGVPAASMTQDALQTVLCRPPGTRVRLRLKNAAGERDATLVLREIL